MSRRDGRLGRLLAYPSVLVSAYSGLVGGVLCLVLGIAGGSAFLIGLGLVMTPANGCLAWYFRRRRQHGYFVP